MIHSLYSNREIFLRELISNASDAYDRLRFEAIARPELLASDAELQIRVEADAAAGTVTIRDNGIGMSREEAVAHLGTIAKSGTAEFFGKLSGDQQKDSQLIGQFGVGLLFGVHRGRARRGADAQGGRRRRGGRALGIEGRRRIHRRERHAAAARHRSSPAPEGGCQGVRRPLPPACPHPAIFRSHRLPGADAQGRGGLAGFRAGQPGQGALDAGRAARSRTRSTASSISTSPTTTPIRSPGATTRSKASVSTPACSTCPAARPSTCGSGMPRGD